MKKNIFMTLVLLSFVGCSEKEPTPKSPKTDKVEIRMTNNDSVEFIPEHIKRSRIEVVKHY
jgi:PBP1b-binding outer membrane lipoprotein LpoB